MKSEIFTSVSQDEFKEPVSESVAKCHSTQVPVTSTVLEHNKYD